MCRGRDYWQWVEARHKQLKRRIQMEWKQDMGRSGLDGNESVYEKELGLNFRADIRLTHPGFAEWRVVFRSYNEEIIVMSGVEDSLVDAQRIVLDTWSSYVQSLQNSLRTDEERQQEIDRLMLMRDV